MIKIVNILHLSADIDVGGSQKTVLAMAESLNKEKYRLRVCYWKGKGELKSDIEKTGAEVIDLDQQNGDLAKIILKLIKVITAYDIKLIHSHLFDADMCAFLAGKIKGVPILISSVPSFTFLRSAKHRLRYKILSLFFDRFVPISETLGAYMIKNCRIDPCKITPVHTGFLDMFSRQANAETVSRMRAQFGLSQADLVVGTVARLDTRKGYFYLLDAAAVISHQYPYVKFLCAGDGELKASLEVYAKKLGLGSKIIFAGTVNEIPSFLSLLDIFTLPSLDEGLGIVILEAMTAGLPVVASRVGGIPEMVDNNETGYLIKPADADELAAAIIKLIKDKELRLKMGALARERVKRFSALEMAKKIEAIYDSLIQRKLTKG